MPGRDETIMRDSRTGVIFRVEVIREEAHGPGGVAIDVTAYIDHAPDDNEADFGTLSSVPAGMWNTRMLYTGDFASLAEAIAAIEAIYPDIERLNCYEWAAHVESAIETAPLTRSGGSWSPGEIPSDGAPSQLDWRLD
jgi:hypothetical protein